MMLASLGKSMNYADEQEVIQFVDALEKFIIKIVNKCNGHAKGRKGVTVKIAKSSIGTTDDPELWHGAGY
jgi:hypothetical protein